MPDFDANEDVTRLPGTRPEGSEEAKPDEPPTVHRGSGFLRGRRRVARRRVASGYTRSLRTRRRAQRLACGPVLSAALLAPVRSRRARCHSRRAAPPGTRG